MDFTLHKRLTLKIGSSLLVDGTGKLRTDWIESLAADIAQLRATGTEVLIVSSGSVALGKSILSEDTKQPNRKQAAAACGQPLLMHAWQEAFNKHGLHTAQILLTLNDTESRSAYLNARNTIRTLLNHQIIPIINENDSVTTHGILYGDNDRLSARIATMCDADCLLLLSDVDGFYDANPTTDSDAQFIATIEEITPAIQAMAGSAGTIGSGGMVTKLDAANIATRAGCDTFIANGQKSHPLSKMEHSTHFIASKKPLYARQRWISGSIHPSGTITIDAGAAKALADGSSLLHVGIIRIDGNFNAGDVLEIKTASEHVLAKGLSNLNAAIARQLIGKRSDEICDILGYEEAAELIHRDHMVLS
ncbi:MAG: glutamate 5-kinase [Rickettsiales bacterium]|nr:glutamate 5-kinase [Rickettsiales bacterium]